MGSTEEPERKRRHVNHSSISPALKKQASLHSTEEKKVDAAMLQYQNQKLEQQLDVQRSEINALEGKCNQLKTKQTSLEGSLHTVRNAWGMLLEKVEHLSARANHSLIDNASEQDILSRDNVGSRSFAEEDFFQRLLATGATENSNESNDTISAELTLKSCRGAALESVEPLFRVIDTQRARKKELLHTFQGKLQNHDADSQSKQIDDNLSEVSLLRSDMDTLHLKHKDLLSQVRLWRRNRVRNQADIKILAGELEETIVDLGNTRQKIVALRSQKDSTSGNGGGVKTEASDRMDEKPLQDSKTLEAAVEEAKSLASLRLKELEDLRKEKGRLFEQLHKAQDKLKDEQHITTSYLYNALKDQVETLSKELEQFESQTNNSMIEQDTTSRGDGDVALNTEPNGNTEPEIIRSEQLLSELETKLRDGISKWNSLSIRLDEISHALDRQDEVAEFKVMVSTLEKEMGMMQQQLDKYKEAACGAEVLRAEAESTSLLLERKANECKFYTDKIADQRLEVKSLREEARLLRESEQELKLILDMYGSESADARTLAELREAECSALAEVEKLKSALDDHGLELRVRVANEAEAACQQRLAVAEAEILDFRQRLDASERVVMELKEATSLKSEEHDACLAEIETIGQAYEDMQTQNQRLLQQISKRDEYNIKLVSESVKSKQLHSTLNEERQALLEYIQHATNFGEGQKQRVARLEQQVKLHLDQLNTSAEDGRQNASTLEVLKRSLAEADNECVSTKAFLEATQKEIAHRKEKVGEILTQLDKEKLAKKKVQEDIAHLKSKLARTTVQSDGSSLVEKLQDEVKEYKAILKCSVCHDRPKEVVITKCYHLFCNPCIQRNLEIRHRKCPGCGITFGQSDVRTVYI
ncbi:hypothetical protein GOP47_0014575 [Adiantum capillus-veneris]|uniref:E3 ubiquitin protein ligase n=1 Tax=Adiantum capillus-veneris TaxID=13818 RepID=A0A9D4UM20_ADICA|nr:hypothetical protein GOP47_0014575 [Adiantum capillus-veneris]